MVEFTFKILTSDWMVKQVIGPHILRSIKSLDFEIQYLFIRDQSGSYQSNGGSYKGLLITVDCEYGNRKKLMSKISRILSFHKVLLGTSTPSTGLKAIEVECSSGNNSYSSSSSSSSPTSDYYQGNTCLQSANDRRNDLCDKNPRSHPSCFKDS